MKKLLLLNLLFLSIVSFGNTENAQNLMNISNINDSLKIEITKLTNQINQKFTKLDSLNSLQNLNIESKNEQIKLYQNALEVDAKIFSGLSTYFTIISILLSIIVVAIPVINYFLVLKPNKKSQKKIESLENEVMKKIENNFETYFRKLNIKKNKKMIALLDDRSNLSEVVDYFLLRDNEGLEEEDISKIISFLDENNDIEKTDKFVLNSLVIHTDFLISEKYFKSVFDQNKKTNYEYAIKYFVENNFPQHIPYISKIIKADEDGHKLLISFFDYVQEYYLGSWTDKKSPEKRLKGEKYALLLFDSQVIIDAIKDKIIPKNKLGDTPAININRLNANSFLRSSKYYSIYLKEMDENHKK